MPYSIVLDFYSTEQEINKKSLNSRILSAFVLNVIRDIEPELSQYLHDQQENKSFTLRMLYCNRHKISLRLTLLDDSNFSMFSRVMLGSPGRLFDLNGNKLKIDKITSSPDSDNFWANYTSYSELFEKASRTDSFFLFNIDSPLAFKKGDAFNAFPQPELFFKSLHKRWNAHNDLIFGDELLQLTEKHIYAAYFDLKTVVMRDKLDINFTGSIGKVEYKISGRTSGEFIHYLNVLSDYAYYAGVGAKTSMGMGQVHRLIPKTSPRSEATKSAKGEEYEI